MSATTIRFTDETAHRHAVEFAVAKMGLDTPPTVTWDLEHHLQGHFELEGRHLVLIASRTDDHTPRVLSDHEWDALRHRVTAA